MMSRGMLLAIRADGASVTQCLVRACSRQESRLGTRALSSGLNILSLRCMLSSDVACVFMPSGADSALLDASSCLSSLHAWHAVVRLVVLWSSVRDGMTMKSSMCPTAASLRCVVVVDHVGVLVLSVAEHNVERSAPGVHRSARPFYRRCAPGLNWPGRASGAVTLKKLECSKQAYALDTLAWDNIIGFRRTTAKAFAKDVFINQERKLGARRRSDTVLVSTINDADQGLADVTYRTPPAPYEKSKSLGSGGSMVARLKLKGIDGRAPPGIIAIVGLQRGIPSKRESSARVDYVPALCTHRPSLLPIEWSGEVFGSRRRGRTTRERVITTRGEGLRGLSSPNGRGNPVPPVWPQTIRSDRGNLVRKPNPGAECAKELKPKSVAGRLGHDNPVNHRVFERKLRPTPFGRGHVCLGVTHRCPQTPPPRKGRGISFGGGSWPPVGLCSRCDSSTLTRRTHVAPNATPGQAGLPAEFKHINKRRKKKLTRIPLVTASEPGSAQLENRTSRGVRIVVWRSVLSGGPGPSPLEGGAGEGESPVVPGPCRTTRRCRRVGLFGNAAPIGRVKECLKLSGGKRMGAGDAPRSDVER
uniref:Uncharacterized protein n=1 Tax=Fagus sylvatica TaxID=28930 RepID=A0A2N9IL11_FAGSY